MKPTLTLVRECVQAHQTKNRMKMINSDMVKAAFTELQEQYGLHDATERECLLFQLAWVNGYGAGLDRAEELAREAIATL